MFASRGERAEGGRRSWNLPSRCGGEPGRRCTSSIPDMEGGRRAPMVTKTRQCISSSYGWRGSSDTRAQHVAREALRPSRGHVTSPLTRRLPPPSPRRCGPADAVAIKRRGVMVTPRSIRAARGPYGSRGSGGAHEGEGGRGRVSVCVGRVGSLLFCFCFWGKWWKGIKNPK